MSKGQLKLIEPTTSAPYSVIEGLEKLAETSEFTPVEFVPSMRKIYLKVFSYLVLDGPIYLILTSNLPVSSEDEGVGRVISSKAIQCNPAVMTPKLITRTLTKPLTLSA